MMPQYRQLLLDVLSYGETRSDRTGVGTTSLFGRSLNFDLRVGFPLLTEKKVYWRGVVYELLWFLRGGTNTKFLTENKVHIWDAWADENGDLGRVYGAQWRGWRGPNGKVIDQVANLVEDLKTNPWSRRHLIVAYNPGELDEMALPPCHCLYQFYVSTSGHLSCQVYQRSADLFLGVPFDIASYALLTHMLAHVTGLKPGKLSINIGDAHIYNNHVTQVEELLSRTPRKLPTLTIESVKTNIFDLGFEDLKLEGYDPHPTIKGDVAI